MRDWIPFSRSSRKATLKQDTSDVLTAVSPSSAVILGYGSLEEMIGQRMANFWANPEERDKFLVELSRKGMVSGYRASFLKKDGVLRSP